MSMLFGENKCFFKAACALAFGLTLALTACDGDDEAIVRLGDSGAETPSPATSLPSKIENLVCSDSMEVDGRYLKVVSTQPPKKAESSYYKCENGKWTSVSEADIPVVDDMVLQKCIGAACLSTRTFADFRKCNAKNEGLVDSVVDLEATMKIRFYTCEDNEWVYDDEATCDANLPDFEPDILCDESYEIDGAFYKYSSFYNGGCGDRYYKCENNKWTAVSKGDVGAIVIDPFPISSRDLIQRYSFKKCNAENEGLVDSVVHVADNPKYDHDYTNYYKCEQGSWNQIYDRSFACDTAGVSLGDVCKIEGYCYKYLGDGAWDDIICLNDILPECDTAGTSVGAICTKFSCRCWSTFMGCLNTTCSNDTYIYMGDGVWENLVNTDEFGIRQTYSNSPLAQWTKECTAENEGETEKQVYGIDPDVIELYFRCVDGKWTDMSETDYYCPTEKPEIGDTCSFELGDSTRYYMFTEISWVKATVDSVLGYCPVFSFEPKHAQKDGKKYYCEEGEWLEADLDPQQNTDSSKEGQTDEE